MAYEVRSGRGFYQMGADQPLMSYRFDYMVGGTLYRRRVHHFINARNDEDAGLQFVAHLRDKFIIPEENSVKFYKLGAAPGPYFSIFCNGTFELHYNITKTSSAEGKRLKRKWVVYKRYNHDGFERRYFSSREKAARWVVLDA